MTRINPVEEVATWWQIAQDRIPQLQKIATDNNLIATHLLNYEALYYLMYQWNSPMTKPWTPLDSGLIQVNEIARLSLAKHANLFIQTSIINHGIKQDIKSILPATKFDWIDKPNLDKARKLIKSTQDRAIKKYKESRLYTEARDYCDIDHADTINTAWNLYLLTTYRINNFLPDHL